MKPASFLASLLTCLLLEADSLARADSTGMGGVTVATAPANPMLHTVGSKLVDARGQPVTLRGVNLGGWLLWEGWIFGEGFRSESDLLKQLNSLAGFAATQAFRQGVYSNFIAEDDLRKLAELGFNSVRVPINYRLLDSGAFKPVYQEAGWKLLDRLLDWCDQYRLYAVIDLHAAPGGQTRLFTADPGGTELSLWQSPEYQRQTVAIWRGLARRYKDRTCIAGYDLINEPSPAHSRSLLELCQQLVAAVRAEDQQHTIFIEGGVLATDFSMFEKPLDANLAYSFHIYTWFGDNRRQRLRSYEALARQQNVPLWAGEFGENTYEMIGSTTALFEQHPEICGWAFWPWKRAPTTHPGLVTITVPTDWQQVMSWMAHPLLHRKPTGDETRHAMESFLEAVKLANGHLDERTVHELLGHGGAVQPKTSVPGK